MSSSADSKPFESTEKAFFIKTFFSGKTWSIKHQCIGSDS